MLKGNYNCAVIHGDKSQFERTSVIEKFKAGKIPILLATDVIGRGIDFPNVSYIFNYDTPKSIDDYVHRIGRTGRCGNTGKSYSFINESSRPIINDLYNLLKKQNKEIPDFIERMYRKSKGNYQYRPTSYKTNYQGHNRQQHNRYNNTHSGSQYPMLHEKMSWRNK
jgi:ATP-dependent RNA helicase DDX3X